MTSEIASEVSMVNPRAVMAAYEDGDGCGWPEEFASLLASDGEHLSALLLDVQENGFREPILLGNDGRLWDGHHRLLVALLLGVNVPSTQAAPERAS